MDIFKSYCIIVLFSIIAIGCGSQDRTFNGEVSDEAGENGGPIIVSIASGGSIEIPEGALPGWDEVNVETTVTPILPDDMEPLGQAYLIRSSTKLSKPATLRLPIPDDVQDISFLAIVRVEDDGTISLLTSSIEENEIVAGTPGFSTFIVVKKVTNADKTRGRH